MFNDNDRIAAVRQSAQNLDQLMDIGKMQSRRRLIQNVDRLSRSSLAQLDVYKRQALGEVIGTGFFGAIASYPLMKWFYGLDAGSPYYYIPFYTPSAVMGAAMGVAVLLILRRAGVFSRMLQELNQ